MVTTFPAGLECTKKLSKIVKITKLVKIKDKFEDRLKICNLEGIFRSVILFKTITTIDFPVGRTIVPVKYQMSNANGKFLQNSILIM